MDHIRRRIGGVLNSAAECSTTGLASITLITEHPIELGFLCHRPVSEGERAKGNWRPICDGSTPVRLRCGSMWKGASGGALAQLARGVASTRSPLHIIPISANGPPQNRRAQHNQVGTLADRKSVESG